MTTGVVATVRGHVLDGFAANPVAPVLVALAVVAIAVRVVSWARRRPVAWRPGAAIGRLQLHPALLAVPLLGLWLYELHRFGKL